MQRSLLRFVVAGGGPSFLTRSSAPAAAEVTCADHVSKVHHPADTAFPTGRKVERVVIVDTPAGTYVPPAAEAPELLQPYVEPIPFISPKRLQIFGVSMAVGMVSVASVYFFISKNISTNVEEQRHQIDLISQRNELAEREQERMLPDFAAPSTYGEVYAKVLQHQRELLRQEENITKSTSTLHTETLFRLKRWWNVCLTNVQDAVDRFFIAQERRQESRARDKILASLQYSGYAVLNLRKMRSPGN